MKRIGVKVFTIIIYALALLWFVDFKVLLLIEIKSMLMVFLGTLLLTLSSYKRDMHFVDVIASAKWNSQVTAYLTTFVLQFALLSREIPSSNLLRDVTLNCRPLLYALLIYFLLHNLSGRIEKKEKNFEHFTTDSPLNLDECYSLLAKQYDLTSREIDIACRIYQGQTNKEIGSELFISENTVKKHVYNLFKKMGVSNREQFKNKIHE